MKKLLFTMLFMLIALLMASCEKADTTAVDENMIAGEEVVEGTNGGIYLDGNLIIPLRSAFVGGAFPTPYVNSNRCHIYEKKFKTGPLWNEVKETAYITGVKYSEKEYSSMRQSIERIEITVPAGVSGLSGTLAIPLTQGQYNRGCEKVSAVKFHNYDFALDKEGKIDIEITLTDGRSLRIYYAGATPYDGYI